LNRILGNLRKKIKDRIKTKYTIEKKIKNKKQS